MFSSSDVIETIASPRPPSRTRASLLPVLGGLVVAVLFGRSFYLQVWQGGDLLARAENNRVAMLPAPAPRGIVYDWRGTQLVENVASTDLVLDPASLPPEEHEHVLIEELPSLIGVTVDEVRSALVTARQTQQLAPLKRTLDHDMILAVEQARDRLPGVQLVSSLVRRYPYGAALAHVTGYTSSVTAEELAAYPDYLKPTDITGKAGLEKFYDAALHGQHGARYVEVDAAGRPQREVGDVAPVPGAALHVTLDAEFQEYILSVLREQIEEEGVTSDGPSGVGGAVIALDPRSGAVRALVNYPSYDPNIFSQPALNDQVENILKSDPPPLFNRIATGAYPPGSTIKPLLAAAALNEGIVTPETTFVSSGGISYGVWRFPDWKAGGHGITDVGKALAESVNTFFYIIGGGIDGQPGLGVRGITDYLGRFGWGAPTGIDLPNETAGFLPSPEWKEAAKDESWYIGDTYHISIGQGDVLASPLQITTATAAVANGGTLHRPFIVRSEASPTGERREHEAESRAIDVSAGSLATVRAGMRQAVTEGSARALSSLPVPVAGKTGTAQIGGVDKTHAWFTGYGPADSPELVVTVLIERGGDGDRVAVPVAQKIWEWWLTNRAEGPSE